MREMSDQFDGGSMLERSEKSEVGMMLKGWARAKRSYGRNCPNYDNTDSLERPGFTIF